MHLPYSEGVPGAIDSTGFILFLFGKMVTVPTDVVQVLQSGTKSPPAIRGVDTTMVLRKHNHNSQKIRKPVLIYKHHSLQTKNN